MEIDSFEEINRLVEKGLNDDALKKLTLLCEQVKNKPNYAGYYWIAKSYYSLDKKKYAPEILDYINLASEEIIKLPQRELPTPALLLKATAEYFLNKDDFCILTCDAILKIKKNDGDAYLIRAALNAKIGKEEESSEDLKKAANFGNKKAQDYLTTLNKRKR